MKNPFNKKTVRVCLLLWAVASSAHALHSAVSLVSETKITEEVMFFDGNWVPTSHTANNPEGYDYTYGNALTPHGDCVKAYKQFVFLTWYRGGKDDRHVMLSRYNTETGVLKTIEFPHRHTGFDGKWWIGETHNTIAVGISPKNETVHLLYDMHRNGNVPEFADDYLRYSYTVAGAATVPDEEFTLDLFVNSEAGHYKHLSFPGINNDRITKLLTYPAFFTNDDGDLFMKMRFGYDRNGQLLFARYDGERWYGYDEFNQINADQHGSEYTWGLYGDFKFLDGKFRIGFQRRYNDRQDKYEAQDGVYYAYSEDPTGVGQWKDPSGQDLVTPLVNADLIKIAEPGDWVQTTQTDQVWISSGFDFTVTDAGDEHFVSQVQDREFNVTKKLHTYRKAGETDFTTVEYNAGSSLYASGTDVFVIGLKGGRVNIVKTQGGASDFQEVYQHTDGPTFDKGIVDVQNGKAYYYLKQAGGSGDKRTVYLQVFDLDATSSNEPEVETIPGALLAGWESWSNPTPPATLENGLSGSTANVDPSWAPQFRGGSADGTFGRHPATAAAADTTVGSTAEFHYTGYRSSTTGQRSIDFVLTETTGTGIDLGKFHFDVVSRGGDGSNTWTLTILEGSAVTPGLVSTGTIEANFDTNYLGSISVDLTGLDDTRLEAAASVTFRLTIESSDNRSVDLDNVGLSAPDTILNAADTDRNGLPDDWERGYFGAIGQVATDDDDGDGYSHLEEYTLGTDPTDTQSTLRFEFEQTQATLRISWHGTIDRGYRIYASHDGSSDTWHPVSDILEVESDTKLTYVHPLDEQNPALFKLQVLYPAAPSNSGN